MQCSERDQDILLLQHGELNGWRRYATLNHLRTCPCCQEKADKYRDVSRHIANAFRQEGGLPSFALPAQPMLAATTPPTFSNRPRQVLRPAFLATVSAVAVIIIAGAYVYKAMALTPDGDDPVRIAIGNSNDFATQATKGLLGHPKNYSVHPKDSSGNPTIFPYSTPDMHDDCPRK